MAIDGFRWPQTARLRLACICIGVGLGWPSPHGIGIGLGWPLPHSIGVGLKVALALKPRHQPYGEPQFVSLGGSHNTNEAHEAKYLCSSSVDLLNRVSLNTGSCSQCQCTGKLGTDAGNVIVRRWPSVAFASWTRRWHRVAIGLRSWSWPYRGLLLARKRQEG